MEMQQTPEPKTSLVGRLGDLIKEKKNEVLEKYGNSDWKTTKEVLQAHAVFIGGMTLAGGLAVLGGMPEMGNIAFMPKIVGASVGVGAVGAEAYAMLKIWAVNEKDKLKTAKS